VGNGHDGRARLRFIVDAGQETIVATAAYGLHHLLLLLLDLMTLRNKLVDR
jgi:hypothetical protein